MTKKQVRDGAYYEKRLEREHPAIFGDLRAGKYGSVTEAAIAAGMKKPRTRLHELKNAWAKAPKAEQLAFAKWLRSQLPKTSSPATTTSTTTGASKPKATAIASSDRRLKDPVKDRIREIMDKRGLTQGGVMDEIGFKKGDGSLGMALHRDTQIQPGMIIALEKWLKTNSSI